MLVLDQMHKSKPQKSKPTRGHRKTPRYSLINTGDQNNVEQN